MEIYKDLSNPASKEFEKLLNSQLSKNTIEEGKIIEGKINKITEKFVFLFVEGLKSEPVLDINELKNMGYNVLLDDRKDGYGVKMKDSELIGIPLNIIIGKKYLENKEIELVGRNGDSSINPIDDIKTILDFFKN